jgi:hypothetical protein
MIAAPRADLSASVAGVDGQAREQTIRDSKYPGREPTTSRPRSRADRGRGGKRHLRLVPAPVGGYCAAQGGVRHAPALPEGAATADWSCHDHDEDLSGWNHQGPLVPPEALRQAVRRGPELDDRVWAVSVPAALLRPRPSGGQVHAQARNLDNPASGRRRCADGYDTQSSRRSRAEASCARTADSPRACDTGGIQGWINGVPTGWKPRPLGGRAPSA